ncbi:MAG: IS110 family transposase [Anaerolineae bacterium]
MPILYRRVAGVDVHKRTVVVTRMRVTDEDRAMWETETFGTTTPDLLRLHDWLLEWAVSHVAMESTGDYWKPVYNVLEDTFELLVVNAKHVKHVPGRKTDVKDSEWLAELMMHGLLKASFIPPRPQRALRDMTRYRTTLVQERTRLVNRVQKLLEGANIKLSAVATDIMGVSARAMLAEIAAGQTDPVLMAELARGQLRAKIPELEKALTGIVLPHHRFLLVKQLAHIDFLDEQVKEISAEIGRQLEAMSRLPDGSESGMGQGIEEGSIPGESKPPLTWLEAIALLDTIPGVNQQTAEKMLAEMGLDMSRFPTAGHLATWTGLAPGNHQSGGKRYSGRTTKGNEALTTTMVVAAWTAVRTQDTFLKARYHRLAARRGKKRAIVAVAHSMLVSAWHMLTNRQPYQELGGDYFDQRKKEAKMSYLIRQLEKLSGGSVSIEIQPAAA